MQCLAVGKMRKIIAYERLYEGEIAKKKKKIKERLCRKGFVQLCKRVCNFEYVGKDGRVSVKKDFEEVYRC